MYTADNSRYDNMRYNRSGRSGIKLSALSLGLWHNFGSNASFDNMTKLVTEAFDKGITHFDLANNYGPYPGSAEENFGRIMQGTMAPYRDELIISTKAGYVMWPGPYGDRGSRKYLVASLDQSLKRMGLDYVDIFYHHRPDPETPLEETASALDHIVRSGKALYVGISNYGAEDTLKMSKLMRSLGTPLLIHQMKYNMLERGAENGLFKALEDEGIGSITFCPLAQGILTDKYLNGIPENSRATWSVFLRRENITASLIDKVSKLNSVAASRGQTLAQMAVAWNLNKGVTSVLIGASKPSQIEENVKALENTSFEQEETDAIYKILAE